MSARPVPAWLVVAALALVGCGGARSREAKGVDAGLPRANPVAVQRMVEGVAASKDAKTRARAIALLREAVQADPNLWEARFDLGVVLAVDGDLASAEDELARTAQIAPDREDVALALAEVRRRRGSYKEAVAGLEAFAEKHPAATEARVRLVKALRDAGQNKKAVAVARDVLVRKPGDANALSELALCHLGSGERETAQLLVKQALDVDPKSARAHRAQGLVHLAWGDDAQAFASFQKAAQLDPHDTASRLAMGAVLLRAGAYAKAAEQYRNALAASPDETTAQIGLAAALRGESSSTNSKGLEESKSIYEKVLARDPHNAAALFDMGILLSEAMKNSAAAKPYFDRFLDIAPKDHPARAEAERQRSLADAPAPPPVKAPAAVGGAS